MGREGKGKEKKERGVVTVSHTHVAAISWLLFVVTRSDSNSSALIDLIVVGIDADADAIITKPRSLPCSMGDESIRSRSIGAASSKAASTGMP